MLMYHGLADGTIPTGSSIDYYSRVNSTMGGSSSIDDFYKLYLVPGMGHCGSSDVAPYYIAAAGQVVKQGSNFGFSVPNYADPRHDVMLAMIQWVENGMAPQEIVATKWKNDTVDEGLVMQRPLCAYPLRAVYSGSGDTNKAESWSCKEGDVLDFPAQNGSLGTVKALDKLGANGMYNYSCGNNCSVDSETPDGTETSSLSSSTASSGAAQATGSKSAAGRLLRGASEGGVQILGWCLLMACLGAGLLV